MKILFFNKKIKLLLSWFLTCSAGLVLSEIILNIFMPLNLGGGYIGNYKYDDALGVRLKTGYWNKSKDYKEEVYVNNLGTINFSDNIDEYKNLVFALGDSFTQGTGLPLDSSYPFQLNLKLNLRDNIFYKDFYVLNLGLSAYGGEQNLLAYKIYKEKIGVPKYILYLGSSNDNEDDKRFLEGYRHRHLVSESKYFQNRIPLYKTFLPFLQYFLHSTEIGKRINYGRKIMTFSNMTSKSKEENNSLKNKSVAEQQLRHFISLKNESESNNSILILSWATYPNDDDSYKWLKDWCQKNNVLFADWFTNFKKIRQAYPDLPFENDHSDGHFRVWVNTVIAESFFNMMMIKN